MRAPASSTTPQRNTRPNTGRCHPRSAAVAAFCNGINAYLRQAYATAAGCGREVPFEFWVAGRLLKLRGPYRPPLWRATDVLAIGANLDVDVPALAMIAAEAVAVVVFRQRRGWNDRRFCFTLPVSLPFVIHEEEVFVASNRAA